MQSCSLSKRCGDRPDEGLLCFATEAREPRQRMERRRGCAVPTYVRSRFMTLVQALTKSCSNLARASSAA